MIQLAFSIVAYQFHWDSDIAKIYLGIGDPLSPAAGGSGVMIFDNISLWVPRCLPEELDMPGDITNDCVVDFRDFEIMAAEWQGPPPVTQLVWDDATMTADAHYWHHDNYHPVRTINGSGMDGDLATFTTGNRWLDGHYADDTNPHPGTVSGPSWIKYDFGEPMNLTDMWVWNATNETSGTMGLRNVTIEYSVTGGPDPNEWEVAWTGEFNKTIPNYPEPYAHETEVNLSPDGIEARYVVITPKSYAGSWGDPSYVGFSEVRFFGDFTPESPADIYPDGIVDIMDLDLLLNNWLADKLWPDI